jgi:hypothetical protein
MRAGTSCGSTFQCHNGFGKEAGHVVGDTGVPPSRVIAPVDPERFL